MLGKLKKEYLFLALIFLAALLLRFYQLGSIPSGFDADEAAYGYNAYSILKTGKDEYGKALPLALKSFGEYKPALYAYLAVPSVALFDLTPFAVRLPAALFGSLTVLIFYFFVNKLVGNKRIALLASLLLAISPWHLNLSRTVSEVVVSLFFIIVMLYGLLLLMEQYKTRWLIVVLSAGLLSIFSYTASTFFVILLIALFFIYSYLRPADKKKVNKPILIILVALIALGALFTMIGSASRFKQVNIFQHPETRLELNEQLGEDRGTNLISSRVFHNKIINYTRTIAQNYGQYFTLNFLVLEGGFPNRERIPGTGLFYVWELLALFAGFYFIIKFKNNYGFLLVAWWLILLLPATITFDEIPNVYRSVVVLPPILILMAIGLEWGINWFKLKGKLLFKIFIILFCLAALWEFAYYLHQYAIHQELHRPWYRGYAYIELVNKLDNDYAHYSKVYLTKSNMSPYIYILFYGKFDPALYQAMGSPRDVEDNKGFGRYIFIARDCPLPGGDKGEDRVKGEEKALYINKGDCKRPKYDSKLIDTIKWKDNTDAFQLVEFIKSSR